MKEQVLEAVRGAKPTRHGWVRGDCPFCEERAGKRDKQMSLGVCIITGRFHCFRCLVSGHIPGIEDLYDGSQFEAAVVVARVDLPEGFHFLTGEEHTASLQPAWDYLESRGITEEQVREFRVGACVSGKYHGRVVIPLFNEVGDWEWWVARAWSPLETQRYMYPSGARGSVLFNGHVLDIETSEPAIVVEGCIDAFPHMPNAVGCLGKPNHAQMAKLAQAKRPVVFALDGDAWEEGLADSWLLMLDESPTGAIRLPPKTDPNITCPTSLLIAARNAVGESFSVDLPEI